MEKIKPGEHSSFENLKIQSNLTRPVKFLKSCICGITFLTNKMKRSNTITKKLLNYSKAMFLTILWRDFIEVKMTQNSKYNVLCFIL